VTCQVALLRGINVGSSKRMAMADLRAMMAALGYGDAETLLQSGNVVYSSDETTERSALRIHERLLADMGMDIPVVVRTAAELAAVVKRNPLRKLATDPKLYHVVFLSERPDPKLVEALEGEAVADELLVVDGREVFVWWPQGAHRARLTHAVLERRLKVTATARNWNTVEKLLAMTGRH
jgi:uncharacterized protein (DUF1697 family)